jgi:hypothetical protein
VGSTAFEDGEFVERGLRTIQPFRGAHSNSIVVKLARVQARASTSVRSAEVTELGLFA